jgi:hypothetical protein
MRLTTVPMRGTPGPPSQTPTRSAVGRAVARLSHRLRDDAGMNTAEYAVGTLAAVAFAGILLKVLTSDGVQAALASVIDRALG